MSKAEKKKSTERQQGVGAYPKCAGKMYLGSNPSVPLTRYLGKSVNIYELQFLCF